MKVIKNSVSVFKYMGFFIERAKSWTINPSELVLSWTLVNNRVPRVFPYSSPGARGRSSRASWERGFPGWYLAAWSRHRTHDYRYFLLGLKMTILAILRALTHTPTHTLALNLNVSRPLTLTLTLQEDIILISMGKDLESTPLIY